LEKSLQQPFIVERLCFRLGVSMASEFLRQLPDSSCSTGPGSVPVFNCIVILTPVDDGKRLRGRVANLSGISAEGNSERELLMLLTKRFKAAMQQFVSQNAPIPWLDPPETPAAGEQQRFIPVHL
jgi:hypothetical protein